MFTGDWKSHIVLACLTCEEVILFTMTDKDLQAAREPLQKVIGLLPLELVNHDYQENRGNIINLFLPTVCSSCTKFSMWKSLSISKSFIQTWQPYLAMCAFLEGDLSLLGSPISMVHCDDIRNTVGSAYVIQSVEINPSSGAAAKVEPHLQSGFL